MRFIGPDLVLATGDLAKYVRCEHATFLDHAVKSGALRPLATRPPSEMTQLIIDKGEQHEHAFVERLRESGKKVVTIGRPAWTMDDLRHGESATLAAMRAGAEYIYQAPFFDGRWTGYADLLERVEKPGPNVGAWSYEVIDLKLSRTVRAHFLLQLSDYSSHVARLQGIAPEKMHVILGTNERSSYVAGEFAAYYRHVRASVERFVGTTPPSPYPVEFCALCEWEAHCWKHWNDVDHLSLVANIRRTQVIRLERGGIATLTALGEAHPETSIRRIPKESFAVINHQARLQLEHRRTGVHEYELLPQQPDRGFLRLPQPSEGDLFLDFEGDPFAGEGLTYLFGAAWEENGCTTYQPRWAHDVAEEATRFEEVMDFIITRRKACPAAHVYHYGAIEASTLKRLAGRHGTRERELDDLLRQEAFVDLAAIVRQAMRISHSSYGLKKVETFFFERTAAGVANAGGAVLAYERWLEENDDALLDEIQKYNAEDCESIVGLRRWLAEIKPPELAWKPPQAARELTQDRIEEEQQSDAIFRRLIGAEPLLAHLLYYHRREERPAWWAYFARQKMTDDELFDNSECIARVQLDESIAPVADKKSKILTYRFPTQDHKFEKGDDVYDTRTGELTGEIVAIDDVNGVLQLRRTPKAQTQPHPGAIMPKPEARTDALREAIRRFATAAIERGLANTPYRATADLLTSAAPRVAGEMARDHADVPGITEVVTRLDHSYLFIQGPPGSGKTYAGARVIVDLLRTGKRVGVTSNSHAAIHNLLHEIEAVAHAQNYFFRGRKQSSEARKKFRSHLANPMIEDGSREACADPNLQLVAGTAWLFADDQLDQTIDYLFIDEAGQVSLANALAASTAARNIILLGDPLQLAQVSQAPHPHDAGRSVLEHLLGEHATVPPERGIFLEESWRMHPDVCGFVSDVVYDSRLRSADECTNQMVAVHGRVENGLRFLSVEHEGNSQSSEEEAQCIVSEVRRMLDGGTFTNSKRRTKQLMPSDFLVVAAYNAQVRRITHALTAAGLHDVPVGTVDKFQGKQAPVVFFSMATSSGTELPRDINFLFSRNRLNVAISRARCVATVVASPRLLDVVCKTPEQMKLVSGLCRFAEVARR